MLFRSQRKTVTGRIEANLSKGESAANKFISDAKEKQGILSSLKQSTITGSYDVRNLSSLTIGEQDKFRNKLVTGITKGIASSLRGGLKSSLNVNYGESQKSFLKDLGHTVSEAMKGAKVNVTLSNVGKVEAESHKGGGGHDAHAGGGHDAGHGGEAHGEGHGKPAEGGHDAHAKH